MRKTFLSLIAAAALCSWSLAWAGPQWGRQRQQTSQYGQNQAVQITNGPTIENVTPNSAILAWSTNTGSSAIVHFGTDPNNLNMTAESPWSNGTHRVNLNNLQPGMTYYYQVESTQGQGTGTGAMSSVGQFQTPAQSGAYGQSGSQYGYSSGQDGYGTPTASQSAQQAQITQGPVVEYATSNSAIVAWSTNAASSSVVKYGTDPNNLTQTAEAPWGQTNHRVTINGLQPSTTYYFQVQSSQAQGTGSGAMSNIASFQTVAPGQQARQYPQGR